MNPIGLKYHMALGHLGITSIPVGVRTHLCTPAKVVELLHRLQPQLLVGRPMEVLRYAEAMLLQHMDTDQLKVKKIILTGEVVSKSKFDYISRIYGGADVYSVYGLTELDGGGMLTCSKYQYHLPNEPSFAVELLQDDFATPVTKDGSTGHIVITNTQQNHMPIIRYKTGDIGQLKLTCSCSEFHTPIVNPLGRKKDLIRWNDNCCWPIQIEEILFNNQQISVDYQIFTDGHFIGLNIETREKLSSSDIDALKRQLQNAILKKLGIHIEAIHVHEPNQLANKLGIAKSKAGSLLQVKDFYSPDLESINFSCHSEINEL